MESSNLRLQILQKLLVVVVCMEDHVSSDEPILIRAITGRYLIYDQLRWSYTVQTRKTYHRPIGPGRG